MPPDIFRIITFRHPREHTNTTENRTHPWWTNQKKQIWMLRIQAYANDGQWALLWRLADEKKNPVGFRPFALAAIRHHQPASELGKYVERITPVEERLDIAMDQKLWDCAVDAAVKLRDANALETIARRCHDEDLQTEISRSLAKL